MVISHSKKFVFVHIYKTAGTSVSDLLLPHARPIEKLVEYYPTKYLFKVLNRVFGVSDYGNSWVNGVHKHASAETIKSYLGSEIWDSYFKFSFVRNLYDLERSLYAYIRASKVHREHGVAMSKSFDDWLDYRLSRNPPLQCDFVSDSERNISLDYIGKVETIETDLRAILCKIDVDLSRIPHKNRASPTASRSEAMSRYAVDSIQNYFAKDFEAFGYEK